MKDNRYSEKNRQTLDFLENKLKLINNILEKWLLF
jgi:hypothetical protein